MKTKFIFETGGVLSGLGKGVTNASIGNLLKARGFKIFAIKLDPYLNIDPSVMSPIEHGEVFVTSDGGETDLDLGHYERFIDVKLTKESSFTSGKIYSRIFAKERNGLYGGKTVQIVPHVIDEIIEILINTANKHQPDFMLVEIGGTVGDIESNPFIYAISKFLQMYPKNSFFNHISFVPYLSASKEYKSKPSQVSIATLRSFGINPNILLLRSQGEIDNTIIDKIAQASFLHSKNVISIPDMANIFEIPLFLEKQHIDDIILQHFNIKNQKPNKFLNEWKKFVEKVKSANYNQEIKIGLLGKYTELDDAYLSIITALKIAAYQQEKTLKYEMINAENNLDFEIINSYDGIIILPGFEYKGFENEVKAAQYTRDHKIPTLGISFGYEAMVISQAIKKGNIHATSEEFKKEKPYGDFIFKNLNNDKMRLGEDTIELLSNSLIYQIYKKNKIVERHRNKFEISIKEAKKLEDQEFIFSGFNQFLQIAEVCEVKNHPFYLGVQFHPEFNSRVLTSHPIFDNFIKAIIKNQK